MNIVPNLQEIVSWKRAPILGGSNSAFICLVINHSSHKRERQSFLIWRPPPQQRVWFHCLSLRLSNCWVKIDSKSIENEWPNLKASSHSIDQPLVSRPRGQLINEVAKFGCLSTAPGLFRLRSSSRYSVFSKTNIFSGYYVTAWRRFSWYSQYSVWWGSIGLRNCWNWVGRGWDLDVGLLRMNPPADVPWLDANSICSHNRLFSFNQDIDRKTLNDLDHGRSSSWVPSSPSGQRA